MTATRRDEGRAGPEATAAGRNAATGGGARAGQGAVGAGGARTELQSGRVSE